MIAPTEDLLHAVSSWADDNPDFDAGFVESVYEYYQANGFLSDNQEMALENIVHEWNINIQDYL